SQDVVITESPPLFLGYSGYLISKFKNAKFVFNVSDLWPESAIKLGMLHNKTLISMSTWLEEFCYRKADLITGQTKGIVGNISSRGFEKAKIHLITNGVDCELFKPEKRSESIRKEFNVEGKFALCYAGIHGLAQGLEVIMEAARKLKEYKDIAFVFVGEGPEKGKLISLKAKYGLDNVQFFPMQPKARMPEIVASMDAAIIPLKKLDLFKGALPSKMFETMASGIPIVLSVEGEAENMIKEANSGICVEPENHDKLKEAILKLYNDRNLCESLGKNGRAFVQENYSRKNITKKLEGLLQKTVETKS
ncbi:MAG TPA: glycosyltransferase WbuB, partial [Clostridiaceae bacterium]|nr:glycosyltransferase WbuB [Clostridiaceae bacterium]